MATADSESEEYGEMRVADPEEYNQTERLRAINNARKQAGDAIQVTMTQLRMDTQFDHADRQQILRAAIYRYLTNIEWLADKADDTDLLENKVFGEVVLKPPERLLQLANQGVDGDGYVVGNPNLAPQTHTIRGIQGYLNAPSVFEHTWTLTIEKRHEGVKQVSESVSSYMPAHVSLNAFRMANQFLSKNGMDVELHEDQHRAVVDREVLEEIEEWRKQNIQ